MLLALGPHGAHATSPLSLDAARMDAWPAVGVLVEPGRALTLADVSSAHFGPPAGAHGTLGLQKAAVWLRIPLQVGAAWGGEWILGIDYAVLNQVDVYLVGEDGRVIDSARLGNLQPYADRPLPGRTLAMPLQLQAGSAPVLYLRVQTLGGMVLPITLSRLSAFHARQLDEQVLQGLLTGLGGCLVLYSLMQWWTLRESLYLKYALQSGSALLFSVFQFGLGSQYLWRDLPWIELHAGGLTGLLAAAGTFLFVEHALGPHGNRWFKPLMNAGCIALIAVAAAYACDLLHVHQVSLVVGTLGLAPAVLGMPGALRRARRGDPVGWLLLAAWAGYFVATYIMVGMIKGTQPVNFWTQHSLQFGATLDMLLFMRVITLRQQELHIAAERARQERESLLRMATTDALTGLPNRRGLDEALHAALTGCGPEQPVALYVMDLDGFKAINDRHGHQVGDELLMAVARRLRHALRASDVLARLGGDEFVVVAMGLAGDPEARRVGNHLLAAFAEPFRLSEGRECRVGLTVGYALAPADGTDARTLMQRADAAMYAGKQSGKQCLRRVDSVAA